MRSRCAYRRAMSARGASPGGRFRSRFRGFPLTRPAAPQVVIFSPARSASQQGKATNGGWKIAFGEKERCAPCNALRSRRNPTGLCTYFAPCLTPARLPQVGEPADGVDQHR